MKFQNNFTAEFWATFSWRLLLQRFFWNSSGVFIISVKLLISQEIFTVNEIELFRTIAEWYLLFFTKFYSHRVKNEKVMTKTSSQLNAPVLMTEARDVFDAIKRYSVSISILHVLQRLNKHFVIIIINVAWVARWTYKEEN